MAPVRRIASSLAAADRREYLSQPVVTGNAVRDDSAERRPTPSRQASTPRLGRRRHTLPGDWGSSSSLAKPSHLTHRNVRLARLLAVSVSVRLRASSANLTEAQKSAMKANCRSDFIANCMSTSPAAPEALKCLQSHLPICRPAATPRSRRPCRRHRPPQRHRPHRLRHQLPLRRKPRQHRHLRPPHRRRPRPRRLRRKRSRPPRQSRLCSRRHRR